MMALVDDATADESFTVDDTHATLKTSDVDLQLALAPLHVGTGEPPAAPVRDRHHRKGAL